MAMPDQSMPSREAVAQFLSDFRAAIRLGFIHWLPRPEDRQHLIDLNITQNQALERLTQLTPENYSKGPQPDDVKPDREVWTFGFDLDGAEVYLKLALQPDPRRRHVVHGLIWSYHRAEWPMSYPLRGKGK
ncbi:MAG: hypothetical protein WD403_10095 [Pirellulales bacterium]